jgi:ubiquinone biosynthesis protein
MHAGVLGALAIAGSMVRVSQPFPFGDVTAPLLAWKQSPVLGVMLMAPVTAAAERLLRPALEALTGRWLVPTLGVSSVLISALTLWLATSIVQPIGPTLASPGIVWLLLGAFAFSLGTGLARIALGLDRVAIDRAGRGHAIWRVLDRVSTPRRNPFIENLRLRQVYDTIAATLIDIALQGTRLGAFRAWFRSKVLGLPGPPQNCVAPRRVRLLLEDLGPTYVKLGQMAISRLDALPTDWRHELELLNASASGFAWPDALEVFTEQLGRPPDELFAEIESEPLAAASTAQVHRAILPSGERVVVKIQRPRIASATKADLGVLQQLAALAERRFRIARQAAARAIVHEFASTVLAELDYRNEAYNGRRLRESMERYPDVRVPRVYPELSGERILTEEFVDGIALSRIDDLRQAGLDPAQLGRSFVRAMIRQILVDGFFHADPHDGNVIADPRTRQVVFLDMGQVGELTRAQRFELLGLIHSLTAVDAGGVADSLRALSTTRSPDERRFRAGVDRVVRETLVYGGSGSLGSTMARLVGVVLENGLTLSSELSMAIKAVAQTEATARHLSPGIDLAQIAIEEATTSFRESITPEQIRKRAESAAVHLAKEVARRLPDVEAGAFKWLDMLNRGRLVVELDTSDLDRSFARAGDVGRQATVGVIVVGQLIGTAIVMGALLQPSLGEFQLLGSFAMAAFALSLAVSFAVLRRVLGGRGDRP